MQIHEGGNISIEQYWTLPMHHIHRVFSNKQACTYFTQELSLYINYSSRFVNSLTIQLLVVCLTLVRWTTTVTAKALTSRQKEKPHDKKKKTHGNRISSQQKEKDSRQKEKTTRQKEKDSKQKENLTAKRKRLKAKFLRY